MFVNYDETLAAQQMIDRLIELRKHEANCLTHFGESALDLATQHKTSVITYILEKHK